MARKFWDEKIYLLYSLFIYLFIYLFIDLFIFYLLSVVAVKSNKKWKDYSYLEFKWNPRFLNPYTDPDFDDFDKNGWYVVAGGEGEYIHHMV